MHLRTKFLIDSTLITTNYSPASMNFNIPAEVIRSSENDLESMASAVRQMMKTPYISENTDTTDNEGYGAVKVENKFNVMMTLEEKVLDFINKHPGGVRISEMEEPFGETRMKLGFIAKNLLDEGKIQKMDTVYYPIIQK
jgi:hypothetical protein